MTNPYLEKAASLYDYWENVSGKKYHELKARKKNLEISIANKETPRTLGRRAEVAGRRMFRARAQAAGVVGGAITAGIVGTKMYEHQQNKKIRQNLEELMKSASMFDPKFVQKLSSGLKTLAANTKSTTKTIGSAVVDTANTAHGGKIKDLGDSVFAKGSPDHAAFSKGDYAKRFDMIHQKAPDKLDTLTKLRKQQQTARVGLYAPVVAGAAGYQYGKSKGRQQVTGQYYY